MAYKTVIYSTIFKRLSWLGLNDRAVRKRLGKFIPMTAASTSTFNQSVLSTIIVRQLTKMANARRILIVAGSDSSGGA